MCFLTLFVRIVRLSNGVVDEFKDEGIIQPDIHSRKLALPTLTDLPVYQGRLKILVGAWNYERICLDECSQQKTINQKLVF